MLATTCQCTMHESSKTLKLAGEDTQLHLPGKDRREESPEFSIVRSFLLVFSSSTFPKRLGKVMISHRGTDADNIADSDCDAHTSRLQRKARFRAPPSGQETHIVHAILSGWGQDCDNGVGV